jgi:hypothetical protein
MKVRAIMKCTQKDGSSITLDAVYGDGSKVFLQEFAKATPYAHLQMTVDNPSAADAFVEGKFYALDFDAIEAADIPTR